LSELDRPPRTVLDTSVIYSRVLYELLGRLATEQRMLTLIWSDELLAEAQRVLTTRKPLPPAAATRWTGYLREAFPGEHVTLDPLPRDLDLAALTTDPDDHHVCALAVAGSADLLLTFDHGYQHAPLAAHGIDVLEPDQILSSMLDEHPSALLACLESQTRAWGGGRPLNELLDAIARARAPRFAENARAAMSR
jgi:predicted nucleic acid-binding protein